jgi:hypothetical protein
MLGGNGEERTDRHMHAYRHIHIYNAYNFRDVDISLF